MGIRTLDLAAVTSTGRFVDAVGEDQWDLPTPCAQWAVRDVVAHLVENNHRALRQLDAAPPETGDLRADYHASAAALHAAFADDAVLERQFRSRTFAVTGAQLLAIHFSDVLVHGWDIGTALGLPVELDEALVEAAARVVRSFPTTPQLRGPGALFADEVAVAEGATPQERLLALTGRTPVPVGGS
jgi:uncharacterized protein (TIGR03086 family)